jgi:hypothetical protein
LPQPKTHRAAAKVVDEEIVVDELLGSLSVFDLCPSMAAR